MPRPAFFLRAGTKLRRELDHAAQERRAAAEKDRGAAAQVCGGSELAHDGRAVSQHFPRGDDAVDRHSGEHCEPRAKLATACPSAGNAKRHTSDYLTEM